MDERKANEALVSDRLLLSDTSRIELFRLGLQFGPDVTERFLKFNNLEYVVRSHEVKQEGYELAHNGQYASTSSRLSSSICLSFQSSRQMYNCLFGTELLW